MSESRILVCFAVKEEAKYFRVADQNLFKVITGMGKRNAGESIRRELQSVKPAFVITAGFAGGLNPRLLAGSVVFDDGVTAAMHKKLIDFGAEAGKFYCAEKVAITAAEKWELWQTVGADAVEMESGVIRSICSGNKIPSATIRVISDAAGEDLPLDFNALMTGKEKIDTGKLAMTILKHPGKIPSLIGFGRQTSLAARTLGAALKLCVQ